ncbi:MAG: NAD-dependent epimerase/dehydratase family protein [Vulcanimicrobiaceae bacterium]
MENAELHVVFGAGQVGQRLAEQLAAAGKRVRIVRRSPLAAAGVEVRRGDASDRQVCIEAAAGATTLYHCMNPPYSAAVWADALPRWMDNLIEAAGRNNARLVVLDNVYALGKPAGHLLSEDSPVNPCSPLGEIRARVAQRLFDAHRRGDVVATIGRASDFYGPGGGSASFMGDIFWRPALAGKTVRVPIDPDAVHTYHYIPDVATGLATLGCAERSAYGGPWMLPCTPAETMRTLARRCAQYLGREIRLTEIPRWLPKTLGIVSPPMRELAHMRYQWDEPFVVDDSRFRARFGVAPTDVERAAEKTVAWAREAFR